MRLLLLTVALALGAPALAQSTTPNDPWNLAAESKARAKDRAMGAVATGDPVAALIAVAEALLLDPDNPDLKAARDRLAPEAIPAAITMAEGYLARNEPDDAVNILADIRAATNDDSLVEPLALARARHLLQEATSHEAAGRAESSKRLVLLAANIRPDDPQVVAALKRHGLDAPPPLARPAAQPDDAPPRSIDTTSTRVTGQAMDITALQREYERVDRRIDDLTTIITRMERDLTLPGSRNAADSSVTLLDREIDDLRRDLDRAVSDLSRQIQSVSRDVANVQRDLLRLR
jgi:hypothetical protein